MNPRQLFAQFYRLNRFYRYAIILALILLPILAGVIYLLDIFIFKSRMPKREDLTNTYDQGAKK